MASGSSGGLGRLEALFACGSLGGKTDAELLEYFASGEAAEAAFEALVVRHGPDVLKACRRVLSDPNDAEDAFQATFLVLARRAASRSIGRSDSLGPWLHGVALRVARKARVAAARRRKHEGRVADRPDSGPSRSDDLATALREEVERLPEPLRSPVVLCYLEDMTYQGAARRLEVSEGAIRGRLVKARSLLRSRLSRHGDLVRSRWPERRASDPPRTVPPALATFTIRAAKAFAPGGAGLPGISAAVAELMEGVLTMTLVTRWMMVGAVLIGPCLAAAGGAALAAKGDDTPPVARPAVSKQEPPKVAARPDETPADPHPAPILTLDDAIERLLRNTTDEAVRLGISAARASELTAAACLRNKPVFYQDGQLVPFGRYSPDRPGGSPQYDINVTRPLDVSSKRRSRLAGLAKAIAEAQYVDSVRLRIDGLYSAYIDVQEMHELIRLQKQWNAEWGRLANKAHGPQGIGAERDSDYWRFTSGAMEWIGPFGNKQGGLARARRRALAKLIDLTSASGTDRLHVEGITPVSALPSTAELVRLAFQSRPDIVALRLGTRMAEQDVMRMRERGIDPASLETAPGPDVDSRPDVPSVNTRRMPDSLARARLNIRQSLEQLASAENAATRDVEQLHQRCSWSLTELREVVAEFETKRRWYQELEQKYEGGNAPAKRSK
jgi:RNA polymerase sigma factor (sigma-70 family)